jgi:protein-disulfide isomerase
VNKKLIVIASVVVALLVFALGVALFNQQKTEKASQVAQDNSAVMIRPHSPMHGSPEAKVTIIEFFDPACETCSAFYPLVKGLIRSSFGQVNLVTRYAPLHKGSDQVVKILEAARMQNLYWPVLEAMLKSQSAWVIAHQSQPELVWAQIKDTGLDIGKAQADMNLPEIEKIVAQDIADGRALNVTKTPGYFVNGKPLVNFGWEQLQALVADEVRSAYAK